MESVNVMYYSCRDVDWIYCFNATHSYPVHTHINHITVGYILDGMVSLICAGEKYIYHAGGVYSILPDTPHAIEPVNGTAYSMLSACISVDKISARADDEISYEKKLKRMIVEAPENGFLIGDMAGQIGISPYHMIRQFKAACGLTPHQFQIQCRVRKAQRLLEAGKSVTEAAYATGFCDQSHLDRCFHKIVRLTPSEYKQSVRRFV